MALRRLRRLKLHCSDAVEMNPSLDTLSSLEELEFSCEIMKLLPPAALPPSLTKLIMRHTDNYTVGGALNVPAVHVPQQAFNVPAVNVPQLALDAPTFRLPQQVGWGHPTLRAASGQLTVAASFCLGQHCCHCPETCSCGMLLLDCRCAALCLSACVCMLAAAE